MNHFSLCFLEYAAFSLLCGTVDITKVAIIVYRNLYAKYSASTVPCLSFFVHFYRFRRKNETRINHDGFVAHAHMETSS